MGVPTNQAWPWRVEGMRQTVKEFTDPINALEIGTWFGEGSMSLWLDELPKDSALTVIDYWKPYITDADKQKSDDYIQVDQMVDRAFHSTFNIIRDFERNKADRNIEVTMIRGDSRKICEWYKDDTFDFVYIDGSHYYEAVKKDIQNAKRIVKKKFGIICGDDYENDPREITPYGVDMVNLALLHTNVDFLQLPGVNHFHPGPMIAIRDEFESKVNRYDGFWWVYCIDGEYTTINPNTQITVGEVYK